MIKRKPEHLCFLCLLRKANQTGSHFVPAGLLKATIGKRDYEEAYSIDPKEVSTSNFFGRSNLKNTDPTPKPHPHVSDYIFCIDCEKNLSKIESEIIPILDKEIFSSKNSIHFPTEKITDVITLITCNNVPITSFNLFVYSLVWRICIQQRLDHQTYVITAKFDEELRKILNNNIEKSIEDLKKIELDFDYPYTIITCDEITDKTATFINPGIDPTNPHLFYIGSYLVLIHHNESATNGKVSTLPTEVLDKRFLNGSSKEKIKVLKISKAVWDKVNYEVVEYAHKQYCKNMAESFAKKKKISPDEAGKILHRKADEISKEKNIQFLDALNEFYRQEMS